MPMPMPMTDDRPPEPGTRLVDARWALTESGWQPSVRVTIGSDGRIRAIDATTAPTTVAAVTAGGVADTAVDILLPGMPNAHCHAFQRGIAGLTEGARRAPAGEGDDSFWTWRERMYRAVDALDADRLHRIAVDLYRALKSRGYTSVAEFHYVHRPAGSSALDTASALIEAAAAAGVTLLMLPVLYRRGGLDGGPLSARQRRFGLDLDAYGSLLQSLVDLARRPGRPSAFTVGIAPHSLRAVSAADLDAVLALRAALAPGCPVHLHISEQPAEVAAALRHLGTTPIDWLCAHAPVDHRWALIHATHATAAELQSVSERGAVICVCTTTEANLGDGAFDIEQWWRLGGALAIGSDSNVGLDPAEELRWLEYQARLRQGKRSMLLEPGLLHPGTSLWRRAVAGGRRAFGSDRSGLAVGAPAELIALDVSDGSMTPDEAVDDFVFAGRAVSLRPV